MRLLLGQSLSDATPTPKALPGGSDLLTRRKGEQPLSTTLPGRDRGGHAGYCSGLPLCPLGLRPPRHPISACVFPIVAPRHFGASPYSVAASNLAICASMISPLLWLFATLRACWSSR